MVCVVVPVTVRPVYACPSMSPLSWYSWNCLLDANRVHSIGPTKVPSKITPLGGPYLPTPVTIKLDPTSEKVPPFQTLPLLRAPVAKLTDPKEWFFGA